MTDHLSVHEAMQSVVLCLPGIGKACSLRLTSVPAS